MLELIQSDSLLVLISRAHLVDFAGATELLHARRFRAAIDVFPQEPLAAIMRFAARPAFCFSRHLAGGLAEAELDIGRMAVDDLTSMIVLAANRNAGGAAGDCATAWDGVGDGDQLVCRVSGGIANWGFGNCTITNSPITNSPIPKVSLWGRHFCACSVSRSPLAFSLPKCMGR